MTGSLNALWNCRLPMAMVVAGTTPLAATGNPTTPDATLQGSPGVCFGSGTINAHVPASAASGIEPGLGSIRQFPGPVTPQAGGSVYRVGIGVTGVAGKTGTAAPVPEPATIARFGMGFAGPCLIRRCKTTEYLPQSRSANGGSRRGAASFHSSRQPPHCCQNRRPGCRSSAPIGRRVLPAWACKFKTGRPPVDRLTSNQLWSNR